MLRPRYSSEISLIDRHTFPIQVLVSTRQMSTDDTWSLEKNSDENFANDKSKQAIFPMERQRNTLLQDMDSV